MRMQDKVTKEEVRQWELSWAWCQVVVYDGRTEASIVGLDGDRRIFGWRALVYAVWILV